MGAQGFAFEDCPLKHYVRTQGWLPFCVDRRRSVNAGTKVSQHRRLRYFTFCAVGAIDVLMLDVARVLRPSAEEKFDTVVFFDRDPDAVLETQKRIPGACGFPGSFTDVVLANDPLGVLGEDLDYLAAPEDRADELMTRQNQRTLAQRRDFIKSFPFDIINLDLEEFAFKPNDPFPGRVVNSMRKVFEWQRNPLVISGTRANKVLRLAGFTLMFTTQIGPPNMSGEYRGMLRDYLTANILEYPELSELMNARVGTDDVNRLEAERFSAFFKLGLPKMLSRILLEQDWYIDPAKGVRIFEFARLWAGGEYRMLHLVMDVRRQEPPMDRRAPHSIPASVQEAYASVSRMIFRDAEITVTEQLVNQVDLRPTLEEIRARRRKYYPEDMDR
jgi:hypothetical protein